MGVFGLVNQLLNFVLPALWLASALVLWQQLPVGRRVAGAPWRRRWAQLFGSGVAVLLGGLLLTGHDGAMATYVVLAVVLGVVQWWQCRHRVAPPLAPR